MKTKIATAISMLGVLGAGSAAALVNTQILDSGPSESGASAAVVPPASSVDLAVPQVTVGSTAPETSLVTIPESSTSSTAATLPTTTAAPVSEFLTAFNVGDAGVVTVDVVDGRLVLVHAEPKAGWTVTKHEEHDDDNGVEVYFESATVRVEFEATFVDGTIVPEVRSESLVPPATVPAPTNAVPAAPASPTPTAASTTVPSASHDDDDDDHGDDDDYDDDHDDDDHDDDHGGDDRDDD